MTITIIAIHGNGGGAFRFDLVPELPMPVTLVAMTLPGFQQRRLPAGPVTLETFTSAVADAVASVRNEDPAGKIVLLGHGIGGSIALDAVARRPSLARGLILVSPVGVKLDERLFPKVMARPAVRKAAKTIISSLLMQATAGRFLFRPAPRPFAKRFLAEYANAEAFEVMFDLLTSDWFDGLPAVEVPVAIVWGGRDRVLDVDHVEAYEAAIADTRRIVCAEWGHYPMIEQPEEFATAIAEIATELVS